MKIYFTLVSIFYYLSVFSQSSYFEKRIAYHGDTTVFDWWYYPTVYHYNDELPIKVVENSDGSIIVFASSYFYDSHFSTSSNYIEINYLIDNDGLVLDSNIVDVTNGRYEFLTGYEKHKESVYSCGYFESSMVPSVSDRKLFFVKYNNYGDIILTKAKESTWEYTRAIHYVDDCFYFWANLVPPNSSGFGPYGNILYKIDSNFNTIDSIFYPGYFGVKNFQFNNESFFLYTDKSAVGPNGYDYNSILNLKILDLSGNITMDKDFSMDDNYTQKILNAGYSSNGDKILMVGTLETLDDNYRGFIICISDDGEFLWSKEMDNSIGYKAEEYNFVLNIDDNSFIISGNTFIDSLNSYVPVLLKIDTSGNVIWEKFILSDIENTEKRITLLSKTIDNNLLMTGTIQDKNPVDSIDNHKDIWIKKTDLCGFSIEEDPKAYFEIEEIINETKTVKILNETKDYCSAKIIFDNDEVYRLKGYPSVTKNIEYTFSSTGMHTITVVANAGINESIFTRQIEILTVESINVFSNPSDGYIDLVFDKDILENNKMIYLDVLSSKGKLLYNKSFSERNVFNKLDLTYLSNGVYFFSFYTKNKKVLEVKKITILK